MIGAENDPVVEQTDAVVFVQQLIPGVKERRNNVIFGNAVIRQRLTDVFGQHGEQIACRPKRGG